MYANEIGSPAITDEQQLTARIEICVNLRASAVRLCLFCLYSRQFASIRG
jgi:hypothetical protein